MAISQSLYRKWRPQTFGDLKGQDVIRDTLVYALTNGQMSHAYLFCGPRGTGKTTTARLVAKLLNCTGESKDKPCNNCDSCKTITDGANLDVIELDAASNRGIDEIRQLRETVKFAPTQAAYKVFIIDEVHMLTREAFNALLKTLEEPPKHATFILATTEAHKVPATILSRVQRYDFRLATQEMLASHLIAVAKEEKMKLTPEAATFVARLGDGSFRDSLSLLDQVRANDYPEYTLEVVEKLFGYIPRQRVEAVLAAALSGDVKSAYQSVDEVLAQGADLRSFSDQLLSLSQELLESLILGDAGLVGADLIAVGRSLGLAKLVAWIELLADALQDMKSSPIARLPLDVALAKFAGSLSSVVPARAAAPVVATFVAPAPVKAVEPSVPVAVMQPEVVVDPILPSPAELDPPVVETVSVPVMALVPGEISKEDWQGMLVKLKQEAPSLLTSMAHARVLKVEHDVIRIAVPFKMHAEKLNQVKNRQIVETALAEVLGVPMKILAEVVKEEEAPAAAAEDDMVDIVDVFQLEDA